MKKIFDDYMNEKLLLDKEQLVGIIFLIVVFSGIFGWVYEFIFYYYNGGCKIWYMQGGNFLPWINIYAFGSILILLFTKKIRKSPIKIFLVSVIVTGILEYFSGLIIFKLCNGLRLWDYNTEILNFGNIGGFVCLRSVLFFGVSALLLVYGMVPLFIYFSKIIDKRIFLIISVIIFSIIMFDEVYNLIIARILNMPRASDIYKSLGFKYVHFNRG